MHLCDSTLVSASWGFIGGLVASILVTGGRKMLAPIIIKRKLSVGCLCKSEQKTDSFWYIPISVNANIIYNLLVSSVDDTKATITFIQQKENEEIRRQYQATWVNPDIDDPLISLRIGTKRQIRLVEDSNDSLKPINEIRDDSLSGNQDIVLKLDSGSNILGQWLFKRAIVEGVMQEVFSTKLKDKDDCELLR